MNGLCSACKQPVEVVDFRLGEGIVVVRCTACGKQQQLSLSEASGGAVVQEAPLKAAPAPPPAPRPSAPMSPPAAAPRGTAIEASFEPPEGFCPKCVAPRSRQATSCPACGLVYAHAAASSAVQPSAGLKAAFTALCARWSDAPAHVRFLQQAAAGGELAAAGRLYRIRLAQAPTDALAKASLDAAVKMASAPVSVAAIKSAAPSEVVPGRRKKLILMAITFLGPGLLFALIKLLGKA
jgi:hypothetical protein